MASGMRETAGVGEELNKPCMYYAEFLAMVSSEWPLDCVKQLVFRQSCISTAHIQPVF